MSRYTRENARRSVIDTAVFRFASQAGTILSYVVMVRAMSEQDFGVLNLLYALIPVVGTLASLGLEQTLRRYQPEYLRSGRPAQAHWLYRTASRTRLVSSIVVVGIVLLCWDWITPVFGLAPYKVPFLIFSMLLILNFQNSMLQFSLGSHMLHRFSVGAVAITSYGKLVGYALISWLDTLTLEKAILVETIACGISHAFMSTIYRRRCLPAADSGEGKPDPAERRRLLRYGLLNNFNESGSLALNTRVDNFYIAAFVNPLAVGVYSFYTRLNEMTRQLLPVRLFENVVSPMMYATRPEEADRRIPANFTLLLNLNFLFHWPFLAAAVAYHAEIVQVVFGGKYIEHSWLFPLVVGMASLSVAAVPITMVAQYEEKSATLLASKIFALFNIAALLVVVPAWGVYGAAISTKGFDGMKNLFVWWHVRNRARWLNAGSVLLSAALIWGSAVALCYGAKLLLPLSALGQLTVGALILGAAMLAYLRSPALSTANRELLASMAGTRQRRILRVLGIVRA